MPVFPSFTQVFEFPVSYFIEAGYLHILVDIPIVPTHDFTVYHLYKYKALPIFSDGYLLQLSGSTDLVAVSEDKSRFIEVSASMLDSCRKVGFHVLCSFPSVVLECDYPLCLKDIFLRRTEEILTTCNVPKYLAS